MIPISFVARHNISTNKTLVTMRWLTRGDQITVTEEDLWDLIDKATEAIAKIRG